MKWNNNIKARDSLLLCGSNKVPPDTEPVALPIAPRSFLAKSLGWLELLRKKDSKTSFKCSTPPSERNDMQRTLPIDTWKSN